MLENYKEVAEALEETNESVISHRLNDSIRVLTSISVVILPLTLIASIMGMNSWVPFEGDEPGFFLVLAVMAMVLIGLIAYFRRKRWL
jgi:magnesium transporter